LHPDIADVTAASTCPSGVCAMRMSNFRRFTNPPPNARPLAEPVPYAPISFVPSSNAKPSETKKRSNSSATASGEVPEKTKAAPRSLIRMDSMRMAGGATRRSELQCGQTTMVSSISPPQYGQVVIAMRQKLGGGEDRMQAGDRSYRPQKG